MYRLRASLFRTIISQETAFFDESKTGELLSRLSADTQVMQSSVTQNVSMFARSITQGLIALLLMFYISTKLTLAVLAVLPPMICGASVYGRFVKRLQKQVQDALAKVSISLLGWTCLSSVWGGWVVLWPSS
eukprot:COSAG01_NODE_2932_length_6829_cov_29.991976_8_plen_132_part_00